MRTQYVAPQSAIRVARVLDAIGPQDRVWAHPLLVVLAGLPGAGKSTLARRLFERTGIAVLESDAVRKLLFPEPQYIDDEHRVVFGSMRAAARALLRKGTSVLIDATNVREPEREGFVRVADRLGCESVVAWVNAPEPVILARLEQPADPLRLSDATPAIYFAMKERMRMPREPYILVDTAVDLAPAVEVLAGIINEP